MMDNVKSLEGLVMKVNEKLTLVIPLGHQGLESADYSRGVSEAPGEFLKIVIPEWLASMLEIEEGDSVRMRNTDGEFEFQAGTQRSVN
jgi:hypothetical protein